MKVVIDTNVLVPAALRDRGPERVVLFVAEHPDIEWVVSDEITEEYFPSWRGPGSRYRSRSSNVGAE